MPNHLCKQPARTKIPKVYSVWNTLLTVLLVIALSFTTIEDPHVRFQTRKTAIEAIITLMGSTFLHNRIGQSGPEGLVGAIEEYNHLYNMDTYSRLACPGGRGCSPMKEISLPARQD